MIAERKDNQTMPKQRGSEISGFYKRTLAERLDLIRARISLSDEDIELLGNAMSLSLGRADHMIENVVGLYALPLGIATNFLINGRDVLIPMVIEEPSVVAGASLAAKLARTGGGFEAEADEPVMIGQIQLLHIKDAEAARDVVLAHKQELLAHADAADPVLTGLGGGARDIEVRILQTPRDTMVIVHLLFDVRDAMGANAVNTACEKLGPELAALTGGQVHLRILSNLADRRTARATVSIPEEALAFGDFAGRDVAEGIEMAWAFAAADPYRAATHNKGIMNGIDAVVMATGNDWRAVEAGAHAYAARGGGYTSLSSWQRDGAGHLVGMLELPLALGTVGGATRVHPTAQIALKILGATTANELARIIASVGLAQNLAALRALTTEGIQKGHMELHARQVAIAAGAEGTQVELVAEKMVAARKIRVDYARSLLQDTTMIEPACRSEPSGQGKGGTRE
jgi:hydroxymethylglutaryl-CoA reductase